MPPVNKFNIHWQVVRLEAKSLKCVTGKVELVLGFLREAPNMHNYERVLNWLRTTKAGYSRLESEEFDRALLYIQRNKEVLARDQSDMDNDFGVYSDKILRALLKDLEARKYAYQFGGHVPMTHIRFVEQLKQELAQRNN